MNLHFSNSWMDLILSVILQDTTRCDSLLLFCSFHKIHSLYCLYSLYEPQAVCIGSRVVWFKSFDLNHWFKSWFKSLKKIKKIAVFWFFWFFLIFLQYFSWTLWYFWFFYFFYNIFLEHYDFFDFFTIFFSNIMFFLKKTNEFWYI